MNLLPQDRDTLVVARSAGEVLHELNKASTTENIVHDQQEHNEKLFVGRVYHHSFQLSIRPKRPNSFLPMMKGKVESTSSGSIVFVKYSLYPSTRTYLVFWTLITITIGIVGTVQIPGFFVPSISALVLTLIHYIAWANFNMQVRITRDILMKSLAR